MLSVVSSSKFVGFADGQILSWCPQLNLLTISMNKTSLWVYRLDGERIYSVNNKSPITSIAFMSDGSHFCLSGTDGLIKIYDSNNGLLIRVLDKTFDEVLLMTWSLNSTKKYGQFDNLYQLDVLNNLPSLSNETGTVVDEIKNTDLLNFLTVIDSKSLSLNFNNLLTINDIAFPSGYTFVGHLDNNDLFNQFFLVQNQSSTYELIPLKHTLPEEKHLIEIVMKICKALALFDYLQKQIERLQPELNPFYQLFDRYLTNLKDSLPEDTTISTSLNDFLLTGLLPKESKDYWLNQFGERGYKRLTLLGNSIYNLTREIVFTQVISSLERIMIILNDLKGISTWLKDSENLHQFGLKSNTLHDLITKSKKFLKLLYKFIWDVNEEQKLFNSFFNWIKHEIIEKLAKEDDIQSYLNQPNPPTLKHSEIMEYINGPLFHSKIWDYFSFDTVGNAILIQNGSKNDVLRSFFELKNDFGKNLEQSFKEFFKSIFVFDKAIVLDLGNEETNLKVKSLDQNSGIVISYNPNTNSLSVIKFGTDSHQIISNQKVSLLPKLVDYDFKDNKHIVAVVSSNNQFQIHVSELARILEAPTPNYISSIKEMISHEQINLPQPKLLALNKSTTPYGCLFDSNKQNYIVFSL